MLSVGLLYELGKCGFSDPVAQAAEIITDMDYGQNLWIFATLLVGIIIVPGMDMIFVLANSLAGGRRAGLAAIAGIMGGGVVHTVTGTLSVTALAFLIPKLFLPMILVGAGYMVWVGIGLMRSSIIVGNVEQTTAPSLTTTAWRGFLTCLLNPKAWLFILAVYPQFMRPHFGPIPQQALVMGLMTAAVQLVVYGAIAVAAGSVRAFLTGNARATILVGRGAGLLIIAAAIFTGWQGWNQSSSF